MIFCSHCFKDKHIQSIIETINHKGTCGVCGKKNAYVYNTEQDDVLNGLLDELLLVYTPQKHLPSEYPASERHMISDELKNEWNIFSDDICSSQIYSIITNISASLYVDSPELFDYPVGVPEKYDVNELQQRSILKGKKWEEFVKCIKHDNRFHTSIVNTELLSTYLSYLRKDHKKENAVFYRGRLSASDNAFPIEEMGAPPEQVAKEGRANSSGISRLYLADSIKTCIHEIRAGAYDIISIGKFVLKEDITVIDFKQLNLFSPFSGEFDFLGYLINKPILQKIDEEMAKAVRAGDNHLDYIPTQYLCDFIKTLEYENGKRYHGVEYTSTLNRSGYNLAIFEPKICECIEVSLCNIMKLDYDFDVNIV